MGERKEGMRVLLLQAKGGSLDMYGALLVNVCRECREQTQPAFRCDSLGAAIVVIPPRT